MHSYEVTSRLPSVRTTVVVGAVVGLLAALLVDAAALAWSREGVPGADGFWQWVTHLGRSDWFLVLTGVVAIGAWAAGRWLGWSMWRQVSGPALFAFAAVAVTGIAVNIPKLLVGRARPAFVEGSGSWEWSPFAFSSYSFASMPSGHSCTAAAIAASLVILLPRGRWLWWPAAAVVSVSRVVIGVHYVSDVVVGFAFGLAGTCLLARLWVDRGWIGSEGNLRLPEPAWLGSGLAKAGVMGVGMAQAAGGSLKRGLCALLCGLKRGWGWLTRDP